MTPARWMRAAWLLGTLSVASPAAALAPGDLTGDGTWDLRDAQLLQRHLRGEIALGTPELEAADVAPLGVTATTAGNGIVDVADLVVLLRFLGDDDVDGDFLSAAFEVAHGLSPFVRDEDGSGLPDGLDDWDEDGLTNRREETHDTDPDDSDTDDDGVLDGRDAPAPFLAIDVPTDVHAATTYLYTGVDPIQRDVTATIDPARVAVLRGTVRNEAGQVLPGVGIRIEDRPEYGTTRTLADGVFDIVVNGGEPLTVVYERPGHLKLRRRLAVPWRDYRTAPEVKLLARDAGGTGTVSLPPPPGVAYVWQGTTVTDGAGTRRPTVIFQPGTTAQATIEGQPIPVSLPQVTVRATETTKDVEGQGMPAVPLELGPGHDPVWVGELAVDEAEALGVVKRVDFSNATPGLEQQPIVLYLENYLSYPVGTTIDRGALDEDLGTWIPDGLAGQVVEIIQITGGEAQVDTDGLGGADNLGLTLEERQQLGQLYTAGEQLVRFPLVHFSFGCGHKSTTPLPGTIDPNAATPQPEVPDCRSQKNGSILSCESQTLGEAVAVAGTPWQLHYTSERTPGYLAAYRVEIPLTGPTIPNALAQGGQVSLEVQFAGLRQVFGPMPAAPNITQPVEWPGTDAYERRPQGRQPIQTWLRWHYLPAGAINSDGQIIQGETRARIVRQRGWFGFVGPWDNRGQGLGGWSLTPVHSYDARTRVLYRGDGTQVTAESLPAVIRSPHTATGQIGAVAVGPDRRIYFTNYGQNDQPWRVWRVEANGNRTVIAGAGTGGDGGPALNAQLKAPSGLAFGPDGSLYVAEQSGHRVRRIAAPVEPSSIITTVAGTGSTQGALGDGGPATSAVVNSPDGVTVAPDGTLYIAHSLRVRRVLPTGVIDTIAGGQGGFCSGSSQNPTLPQRATQAVVSPTAVALGADGSLFIAGCARIYRLTSDGWVHLFAGGAQGLGDGGPATSANIGSPRGVAAAPDGSVYIASQTNGHRIRRVTPDGLISTIAGDGTAAFSGDGGPATASQLNFPSDVAVAADGRIVIADQNNNRARVIEPPLPGYGVGSVFVPSADGSEVYEFDAAGRHLRTLDALRLGTTQQAIDDATKLTIAYDEDGLVSITDADDNVTVIERTPQGVPTAIVGPFGDRTELTLDGDGWLERIENPADEAYAMVSTPEGLLTSLTTPRQHTYTFQYDAEGRLYRDDDPAGGFQTLVRTETATGWDVEHETALGVTTRYGVARPGDGSEVRTTTDPAGLATTRARDREFETTTTAPTGITTLSRPAADPRLGFTAAFEGFLRLQSPGGRDLQRTRTRSSTVDAGTGVLTSQTDTVVQNGRTSTVSWSAGPGTVTTITPANRQQVDTLDARGRLVGSRLGTLHPVTLAYDARGRIETLVHGPGGAGDRQVTFAYHPTTGRLASITDPANRVTTFDQYDPAGRVEQLTLPGGRVVGFAYDANGNLASLTPPGQPAHVFRYTAIDQEREYEPPVVAGVPDPKTVYTHDLDRRLDFVARPDGKTVDPAYEAGTGRLDTIAVAEGVFDFGYSATTGNLESLTAPGGETLAYGWDGALPLSTTWSGPVVGSVARTFDNDLRVATESVNGAASVTYVYDGDSLVDLVDPASGPDLDLLRNPTGGFGAGLLTGTVQDAISTTETPSAFGELASLAATENGNPLYSLDVSDRDALGRIETKVEAIGAGPSTTTVYTYDPAGRLDTVSVNGTLVADYAYDPNGNRTHEREDLGGGAIAAYDAQDRLASYAGTSYAYSEAGDLETKTDAGGTTAYDFDALGNLRSVVFPDGKQLEYVIDGQSRRVGKKVCAAPCTGGATPQLQQGFLYADQLRIVAELDGSNQVVSRFVYATRPNVPDFLVKNGVTYRILSDQVGSVRLVVDASTGAIAQRIDYDAFGVVTQDTNPGFQPFGFAGGLRDLDTGLVRFGARDYDPRVGRWTTKDPIRFAAGANIFGYVLSNPVSLIDPSGMEPPPITFPGGNAKDNAERARSMSFAEYWNAVATFGEWDFKNQIPGRPGVCPLKPNPLFGDYGNWHFGYTARAWSSPPPPAWAIEMGAGAYQRFVQDPPGKPSGTGIPFVERPFGDSSRDNYWVREGIRDRDSDTH